MKKLHLFELREGHVVLDGVIIRGIRECEFSIKGNDSPAELSLKALPASIAYRMMSGRLETAVLIS